MGTKRKLNQKSLYQEGGAMSSTNSANNVGSLAQDIQSQMQLGVSPSIIYRDMLVSYLPADEINAAFQELGYSQDDVSDLYEQVVEMMNEQQQSSESTMQEAQFGGWVNAPNYYLPMDLGKKGDPLNAALFAGKAVMDLFGGKDKDGDGFKDGAWRDLGKKRKGFKNFKNQKLQSFIPDSTSDTINSDSYDPDLEVANYLKQAQDEERNRLSISEPDFPVTSSTTSATTPKPTTTPTTTPKQTPVDYSYLDPAISQILDFESKSGGYDASMGAYGLTNLGANRYMMGPNSLNINSPTYRADLTERIKQDYAPSLAGFAQEAQPAMLDYAYNTGRDPRIYMLDAYLKEQGQPGLSNRGAYKDAMQDYTWTDKNLEQQFNTEYGKYKDAIGNLSGQDQLRLMNEGRKFYYNNINQVNGQPNPAAQATWLQRPFYKSGGQLPKAQFGIPTTADSLALSMNEIEKRKFYEDHPIYWEKPPDTDNSNIAYIFDEVVNNADKYNKRAQGNYSYSFKTFGSPEERFKVINPNMIQLGDILDGEPNSWYNKAAPPILLHNIIKPKGWKGYQGLTDATDIPYYDPVEIYPKSLGEVPLELYKYSDIPYVNYNTDLVAYLQKEGKPFDKNARKELAKQYGVDNYDFSADKNIELLNLIKKGPPVREKKELGTLPQRDVNLKEILNSFQKEGTYSRSIQPQESGSTINGADRPTYVIENWEDFFETEKKVPFSNDSGALPTIQMSGYTEPTYGKYWGRHWKSKSGQMAPSGGGYYYMSPNDEVLTPDEYKMMTKPLRKNLVFQNGGQLPTDKYGNPIRARIIEGDGDRTHYDPRTNTIELNNDYDAMTPEEKKNVIAHENFHGFQFRNGMSTYLGDGAPIVRPPMMSTDEHYFKYHNRKPTEAGMDVDNFIRANSDFRFVPRDLIFDKEIDSKNVQYNNPYSMEGQATYYENTGQIFPFKDGGQLPKYQIQGEVLPEVTVTPFDNVMPNMPQTFDTIAPDFSGFEDINKNNIPDYLERNDPAKNQMGTQEVQGETKTTSVQGPQLPPDPFDNVTPDMSNTFDNAQGDVSTDTTGEDSPTYNRNPFVEAFGKTSNALVAGANLANEIFQNKRARQAETDFIYSTMADKIYGAYNERPGSRGMWDVNTGLAQPDNLDVGYAQMGMEMSPKLNMLRMFTGGGMVYNDMYMPQYQVGGEAQVDNQTLAALIAAGADIEIL